MYLKITLLLLPFIGEWQLAEAFCNKACQNTNGTIYKKCPERSGGGSEGGSVGGSGGNGQHEITVVKCNEPMFFKGSRMWYELPDGATDVVLQFIEMTPGTHVTIGRLICSSQEECYTLRLTIEARFPIVLRTRRPIIKMIAGGKTTKVNLAFSVICDRDCAKIPSPGNGPSKRIFNGLVATPYELPFMARLKVYYAVPDVDFNKLTEDEAINISHLKRECGGSIIHQNWVLTSATCVQSTFLETDNILKGLSGLQVFLGDHITTVEEPEERKRWVKPKFVYSHPSYNTPTTSNNDIALLKVVPIELNPAFRYPVCIPPDYLMNEGFYDGCIVESAGWGDHENATNGSDFLRKASFIVENQDVCRNTFLSAVPSKKITYKMICAKDDTFAVCSKDLGGPTVIEFWDKWYFQLGVNSFFERNSETTCKSDFPYVATRVTEFRGWIDEKIIPDVLP